MGNIVKKCNKCGRFCVCSDDDYLIDGYKGCDGLMLDTGIMFDEYLVISKISGDDNFLQAMIDLKEKDPIEYQSNICQFKTQVQQQKNNKVQNDNRPKCPTCGSTSIEKISLTKKAFGGAMFGLFSSDVRNSMHCKNCGAKW